jgi:hypothetical protein
MVFLPPKLNRGKAVESLHALDYVVLAAYLLVVVAIAARVQPCCGRIARPP